MRPERLRAIALAEWRGLPETPFIRDTSKPIAEPLAKVMTSLGLGARLREEEVLRAWKEIVGEFIAGQSEPQRIKNGVLFVRVLHSTLGFDLDRVWKPHILEKLRARFGARTVRDVKFRVG